MHVRRPFLDVLKNGAAFNGIRGITHQIQRLEWKDRLDQPVVALRQHMLQIITECVAILLEEIYTSR